MTTGIQLLGGIQFDGGSVISDGSGGGGAGAHVTSNLGLYYNPADSASYAGTGTTINSLAIG